MDDAFLEEYIFGSCPRPHFDNSTHFDEFPFFGEWSSMAGDDATSSHGHVPNEQVPESTLMNAEPKVRFSYFL